MTVLGDAIAKWEYLDWRYEVIPPSPIYGGVVGEDGDAGEALVFGATLRITVPTHDSRNPEDRLLIAHQYSVPPFVTDEKSALAFLRVCTQKTVVHEMDEWIRVDGELLFDPHQDDAP
jgi:hypothetical protein